MPDGYSLLERKRQAESPLAAESLGKGQKQRNRAKKIALGSSWKNDLESHELLYPLLLLDEVDIALHAHRGASGDNTQGIPGGRFDVRAEGRKRNRLRANR
jgi:hypothetical protein